MRPVFVLSLFLLSGRAFAAQDPAPAIAPAAPTTMTEPAAPSAAIFAQLEAATQDLQMPSETDAPFRVVFYPLDAKSAPAEPKPETETALVVAQTASKITPELIAKLAGAPAEAELETRDLDEFFSAAATVEDWMEDEEKATAERFAALLETLKKLLKNPQVVVWGEAEKQVAIIGEVEGGLAGVLTVVVET
jgi:hypothetical protein